MLTAAQSHALGADPSAVRRLVGSGGWGVARRGIYRDLGFEPALPLESGRPGDLVTPTTAAAPPIITRGARRSSLGLLPPGARDAVVITRPPPAPANRLGPRSEVHVARFDESDVMDVAGVPVLAGARPVLDCCAVVGPDSELAVADAAVFRRYTTADALEHDLERRRGRLGAPVAAKVVERVDPLAESWFESISRWWLLEAGLPRPRLQTPFHDDTGRCRARADLWFPDFNTVGKADGAGKYDEPVGRIAATPRRVAHDRTHDDAAARPR